MEMEVEQQNNELDPRIQVKTFIKRIPHSLRAWTLVRGALFILRLIFCFDILEIKPCLRCLFFILANDNFCFCANYQINHRN